MSEVFIECWHCHIQVTLAERSDEDGFCPHCMCELDLEDYLEHSVAAIDTLRTANQRLEGEVARLREALNTAMNSMLDSGYSSSSVVIQLCRAALSTANGEVAE